MLKTLYAVILSLTLLGCSSAVKNPGNFADLQSSHSIDLEQYKIVAGDKIEVNFLFTPELNKTVEVRPDGKISLMFLKGIKAQGKTTDQLAELLEQKLSKQIKQPDLFVNIIEFADQKVYIGGEVNNAGSLPLKSDHNIMQVLSEAGWVTPAARMNEIVLLRKNPTDKDAVYPINLEKIISGEDLEQNVAIKAGDVIYVPPSDSIMFDRFVEQNIRGALPFGTSASYVYSNNVRSNGIVK
ncbi:MAG: polysaccharide biosynthesis/export family protein [Pseudomonadota bacterium]